MKLRTLLNKKFFVAAALIVLVQESAYAADAFAANQSMVWRYTVRPGDNLISFSKTHLLNPDDRKIIRQLNHLKDPNLLPIGSVLKVPLSLLKQSAAAAEVVLVTGEAYIDTNGVLDKVNQGQKLGPGTTLLTFSNSKVVIKFADGTQTAMVSNTRLVLDTMSLYSGGGMVDTKLRLQQGQVETTANPKRVIGNTMQIITPTAIAAVRGTQFRVSTDAGTIMQETLEGKVALSAAGDEIAVNKGYGSFAESGKPPSPPIVLLPAVDTSHLKSQFDNLPLQFDLPKQEGAVAWEAKISADSNFNQVLAEHGSQESTLVFADMPDGDYYLGVRAKDKNGLSGYDAKHAFSVNARPFPPDLSSPAKGGVLRNARPTLEWLPVEGATAYNVEIATDNQYAHLVEKKRVQDTKYQVAQALAPGQYFWRVNTVALAANGVEDIGLRLSASEFSYKALPPKPDISAMHVTIVDNRVLVQTSAPEKDFRYRAVLHNPFNHQEKVWVGDDLQDTFSFLLKEYGEQVLSMSYVDVDGVSGPEAIYTFLAPAQH